MTLNIVVVTMFKLLFLNLDCRIIQLHLRINAFFASEASKNIIQKCKKTLQSIIKPHFFITCGLKYGKDAKKRIDFLLIYPTFYVIQNNYQFLLTKLTSNVMCVNKKFLATDAKFFYVLQFWV